MYDFVTILANNVNLLILPILWTGFISIPIIMLAGLWEEIVDYLEKEEIPDVSVWFWEEPEVNVFEEEVQLLEEIGFFETPVEIEEELDAMMSFFMACTYETLSPPEGVALV